MDFKIVLHICVLVVATRGQRNLNGLRHKLNNPRNVRNCDIKFQAVSPQHTACLEERHPPVHGLSPRERGLVVHFHNKVRSQIEQFGQPEASDMLKMVWDKDLEKLAQKWASNCIYKHDSHINRFIPGKYTVGQNIGWSTIKDWPFVMNAWFDEHEHFEYGVGSTDGGPIGHYTQMVWASSTRIGCGYAYCNGSKHYYVCNYGPMGNIENANDISSTYKPYSIGSKGSKCQHSYNKKTGTCDCGGKICFNGGTLDVDTCTCKCTERAWINKKRDCSLDCSKAQDTFICESAGGPWTASKCTEAVNVPYDYCPITCRLCPVSGDTYFMSRSSRETTLSRAVPGTRKGSTEWIQLSGDQALHGRGKVITTKITTTANPRKRHQRKRQRHRLHRVGTKGSSLGPCQKADPPKCGQPNKTGYWPTEYCTRYTTIATMCPAMCGKCTVTHCKDYEDNRYSVGETWVSSHGRLSCTQNGVHFDTGCFRHGNFIAEGGTYSYLDDKYEWNCTCQNQSKRLVLECTGTWKGS